MLTEALIGLHIRAHTFKTRGGSHTMAHRRISPNQRHLFVNITLFSKSNGLVFFLQRGQSRSRTGVALTLAFTRGRRPHTLRTVRQRGRTHQTNRRAITNTTINRTLCQRFHKSTINIVSSFIGVSFSRHHTITTVRRPFRMNTFVTIRVIMRRTSVSHQPDLNRRQRRAYARRCP